MAAFSYLHQYPVFVVDEFQLNPNTKNDESSLLLKEETITSGTFFSPNLPYESLQESPLHAERILETIHAYESSSVKVPFTSTKHCCEEDQVTQVMTPTMGQMRQHSLPTRKVKRESKGQSLNPKSSVLQDAKKVRPAKKQKKVPPVEPPTGYVHVRARRGEATDSHSLAERVRREKIGARMRLLQSLVPGCDKIIGKALILDEIIRYVQYLKGRVESLEAELVFVNGRVLNDFEGQFNLETQAWQELFTSELQLSPVLESGSSHLPSFVETADAPTSFNGKSLFEMIRDNDGQQPLEKKPSL
ncbi:unnamed protein product [Dovyalis caffra]|uniref:BHLH domain-containing protein n=1 Tax=Dovyalis caffra TaxID=77055 RepID=A0AAV1RL56_9ROSI|nr:unnamed protein product [Dovyalis caffra]